MLGFNFKIMKYKVGETVKIKNSKTPSMLRSMTLYCGKIAKITKVNPDSKFYTINIDSGKYNWEEGEFEDSITLPEELSNYKMYVKNTGTIIKLQKILSKLNITFSYDIFDCNYLIVNNCLSNFVQNIKTYEACDCKIIDVDDYIRKLEEYIKFKPFDKVLVRDADDDAWIPNFFCMYTDEGDYYAMNDVSFKQCILYEGNEDLAFRASATGPLLIKHL